MTWLRGGVRRYAAASCFPQIHDWFVGGEAPEVSGGAEVATLYPEIQQRRRLAVVGRNVSNVAVRQLVWQMVVCGDVPATREEAPHLLTKVAEAVAEFRRHVPDLPGLPIMVERVEKARPAAPSAAAAAAAAASAPAAATSPAASGSVSVGRYDCGGALRICGVRGGDARNAWQMVVLVQPLSCMCLPGSVQLGSRPTGELT